MILVIGGLASGKKAYVKSALGYMDEDFSSELNSEAKVLYDLQNIAPQYEIYDIMTSLLKKQVVICNEVGCGLVPIAKEEREDREKVGRLCIELAKKAEKVVRVYCGIGQIIK